jgi:hypothetical protein
MSPRTEAWAHLEPLAGGRRPATCVLVHGGDADDRTALAGDAAATRLGRGPIEGLDLLVVRPEEPGKPLKVDDVRDANRQFRLTTATAGGRVLVVDDAGKMVPAAANALLKLVEEPPEGAFILLLAERLDGVIATLRSRAQKVAVRPHALAEAAAIVADLPQAARWATMAGGRPRLARAMAERLGERFLEGLDRVAQDALAAPCDRHQMWALADGIADGDWPLAADAVLGWLQDKLDRSLSLGNGPRPGLDWTALSQALDLALRVRLDTENRTLEKRYGFVRMLLALEHVRARVAAVRD